MPRGLTTRIVAAGAILLLLIGPAFAGLFVAIEDLRAADAQVSRSADELREASRLEGLLIDMETGLRGFVLTREERFLEPWQQGREVLPREVNDLADRADGQSQADRMRAIAAAASAYIEDYGVPLINAVRSRDPTASSVEKTEQGKVRVDALRQLFADFIETERQDYIARQDAAGAIAQTTTVGATVALGASVALIVLVVAYLGRTLVRPVTHAAQMAGRLAAGDLSTRMPETGAAEIGLLERSFNSLAASLEESQAAQRRLLDQQRALRRVATLVAEGRAPEDVFGAAVQELAEHLPAEVAYLWRYEAADETFIAIAGWERERGPADLPDRVPLTDDSLSARVWQSKAAARISHDVTSSVACPVVVAGNPWGVLVASRRDAELAVDAESWLAAFTDLVGTAISNADARAQVAASRARVVAASDDTRRRIERNLHDGAQQRLVSLGLKLRSVELTVPLELEEVRVDLRQAGTEVTGVIDELREFSRGIYPASLSRGGLAAAVRTLARRSPIPIALEIRTQAPMSDAVQAAGYYVVAEAVTNAAKHASADEVHVILEDHEGMLRVTVRDDGVGGADPDRGSGITGLRDRVEALGGRFEIASPPGEGTTLVADIPIR
jgi:signal transduction histidine kinase